MSLTRSMYDPVRLADCRRQIVKHVQCRSCGYEPPVDTTLSCCPKCRGGCWETFMQVGKLRPATVSSAAPSTIDLDGEQHE